MRLLACGEDRRHRMGQEIAVEGRSELSKRDIRRCFQELRGWQSAQRRKRGRPNAGGEHHSVLFCFSERYGGERPHQGAARPDSSGNEILGEW